MENEPVINFEVHRQERLSSIRSDLDSMSEEEIRQLRDQAIIDGDETGIESARLWLADERSLTDRQIQELVRRLPYWDYQKLRGQIAKKVKVRVGVLDQLRDTKPDVRGLDAQGSSIHFAEPEPWPTSVDGKCLLSDLKAIFHRYMILSEEAAVALSLWTAFTYLHDSFAISPILCIISPEKRCGKTTLLSLLGQLVYRPLPTSNITAAALFRTIERYSPCLLIDEADTFIRSSDELRGILNSGHLKSQAFVIRTVGESYEPRQFRTWGPKAIALIGRLHSTLLDRSIEIRLQRKTPAESVEPLRLDRADSMFAELKRRLARWSSDIRPYCHQIDVGIPRSLHDRAADNWRPLLAIASAASTSRDDKSNWGGQALQAARSLSTTDEEEDLGSMLLSDLKLLFERTHTDRFFSITIVEELCRMEERPWSEYRNGRGISQRQLAGILKRYGVSSKSVRIGETVLRGYYRWQLDPIFDRYCATDTLNPFVDKEIANEPSVTHDEDVAQRYATRNASVSPEQFTIPFHNKEISKNVADHQHRGIVPNDNSLSHLLQTQGYALIRSEVLNEEIVIRESAEVEIPKAYQRHVVYDLEETAMLRQIDPEQLRALHLTKKVFEGRIVDQRSTSERIYG